MSKIELSGNNAFYKHLDYESITKSELTSPTVLPKCDYKYETESKVWRVVKIILAILIPLIGLYWGLHALAGKAIVPVPFDNSDDGIVSQVIYDSSRSRRVANEWRTDFVQSLSFKDDNSWKVKRLTIEVNGTLIDAMIVGKPSTLGNKRWVLQSVGNADLYEAHLPPERMLTELNGNALVFNYPGKGASEGFRERSTLVNTYKAMLNFLEDQKEGIGAKELVLYGHSLGGVVQGEALASHELKKEVRYVAVKDRTPADLSLAAKGMFGCCAGVAVKILGWNISAVESSKNLKCPEIILHTSDKDSPYPVINDPQDIKFDGLLTPEASLGKVLLDSPSRRSNQYVIGLRETHGGGIYNWKPICNRIKSELASQ